MRTTAIQRIILIGTFIVVGCFFLGARLDSISNSLSLINWHFTVIGTVVACLVWGTVNWFLNSQSPAFAPHRLPYRLVHRRRRKTFWGKKDSTNWFLIIIGAPALIIIIGTVYLLRRRNDASKWSEPLT